jgi:PAS domain S-box-containing protein
MNDETRNSAMGPARDARRLPLKGGRISGAGALSLDDCRLLVEGASDYAIFMLDPDGYVVSWNSGAERIKGYTASEIIGEHFSKFFPPEDISADKPRKELETAIAQGRAEDEGWRVRKDGTRIWANVVVRALRDESGQLRGFGNVTRDLTEKRANEAKLRQAEQRFLHLVNAVSDYAIVLLDPDGNVATWNEGAKRSKGYAASEIVGRHFSAFYTPEDVRAGKPARVLETVRSQGRYEEEGWRVRKDGSRFWASVVITPLRGEDGTVTGFAKVTRDLTERQAEERVRQSEERYRSLSRRLEVILEGIAEGITVQDRTGNVVFANTAAAKLSGCGSADEFLRTPPATFLERFEVLDEEGQSFDMQQLPGRRVLLGEPQASAAMHLRDRVTGRERWTTIHATAVTGPSGEPDLAINVWRDVTVERRLERETAFLAEASAGLSSSLDRNEMLAHLARMMVPRLADACTIHLVEGGTLRLATQVDPAAIARDPEDGVWGVVRTGVSELRCGEKSVMVVAIRIRASVVGAISLVSGESGRRYDETDVEFLVELARRAGAAMENAQLYAAAQEAANRAKAAAEHAEDVNRIKDEFLATVSHELRTPLNAIVGWAGILRERRMDPFLEKGIEVIDRNAQAQVKIIDDILDVSRITTGKLRIEPKPADLASITEGAIEVVRPSAIAKEIALEFRSPEVPCLLVADPERLQQVVWNLLSNAVKFTEAHGRIAIDIRSERSNLVLTVSDTGKGIEPELLPQVFDRFKQGDASATRRVGGLGLGLALVRHIIELHGGSVAAESAGPRQGSTFRVTLPVRPVVPTVVPQVAKAPAPARRGSSPYGDVLFGLRVLVVDDDRDARDLLKAVLTSAGAAVEAVGSATAGFGALRRFRPHVLVSDIAMAEEDGYSFVKRIRALDPRDGGGIPSVALTAYTRSEDRRRALSAGFTTHIGKPVNPEDLVAAVANLAALARR